MPKSTRSRYSTRRRWTEADARTALEDFDRSGLSERAFALREGIERQRLQRWRRRLEGGSPASPTRALSFVEVRPRTPERVEVVLRSGRVLRFAEEIEAVALRRLVDVLEQDPRC
jgi:hypothetical protein